MAEMLSDFGHLIGLNGSTQVAVMPTYSTVAAGTIVQYVGSTDANYTNGYFYKATASGWEVVDVQGEDADKADKVDSAINGNLAGLNASGNLTDAGWSADKTTSNASGNPISISGLKSNQLAINPVITLEPIQAGSGDPSPSNVRAISGYDKIEVLSCGKNLDFAVNEISANVTVTNTDTGYRLQSTSSIMWSNYKRIYKLPKNLDFTISSNITIASGHAAIIISGSNSSQDPEPTSIKTVNFDSGGKKEVSFNSGNYEYIYIAMFDTWDSAVSGDVTYSEFMIRDARISDSTYEPYHKTTDISESLGQTVYKGSLDVRTGLLTVTHKGLDMSMMDWVYNSSMTLFYCSISDTVNAGEIYCSYYKAGQMIPGSEDYSISSYYGYYSAQPRVFLKDTRYTDASTLKTALTGQILVYQLTTPFAIQLTPHEISLLKDYAYVSTNGTNISFSYKNGEMASLGDVAQLGETVNVLGDKKADIQWTYLGEIVSGDMTANIELPSNTNEVLILMGVNNMRYNNMSIVLPISAFGLYANSGFRTAGYNCAGIVTTTNYTTFVAYDTFYYDDNQWKTGTSNGKAMIFYR